MEEKTNDMLGMLDLMVCPGFCVKEKEIVKVNPAARGLLLEPGTDVRALLLTGREEYDAFRGGCLYLSLSISGQAHGASVVRMEDFDVFLLEQEEDREELRALALASKELRSPLSNAMTAAEQLLASGADPQTREQLGCLNRGLYQLLRIVGNMSDAGSHIPQWETRNLSAILDEVFEKSRALLDRTGITLSYQPLNEAVYGLADRDLLERAVLNILSNALKFTPRGGQIQASLTRRGRTLRLSVQDSGSGIAENILSSIHRRYLRQPTLEDSRYGIGLGMVLIRSAAASHGGTVLIDQPEGSGTRVTMTLAIRQNPDNVLRSPRFPVDYTGGYDHALVELSGSLPPDLFDSN